MINDLWNKISNNKVFKIIFWIFIFFGIPLGINLLISFTDFLYGWKGWALSPEGIHNKEWLEFWSNYIIGVIALISVYSLWSSGKKDREHQRNVEKAKYYAEHLVDEQNAIVSVCKAFDVSVPYNIFNQMDTQNVSYLKQIIQASRDNVFNTQCELELLTDISVFLKDEDVKRFTDFQLVKDVRDTYYNLEQKYIDILNKCDNYLNLAYKKNNVQSRIQIYNEMKRVQTERLQMLQDFITPENLVKNETLIEIQNEINNYNKEIIMLEKEIIILEEEMNNSIDGFKDLKEINEELKPKLINSLKCYINMKKSKIDMIIKKGYFEIK